MVKIIFSDLHVTARGKTGSKQEKLKIHMSSSYFLKSITRLPWKTENQRCFAAYFEVIQTNKNGADRFIFTHTCSQFKSSKFDYVIPQGIIYNVGTPLK